MLLSLLRRHSTQKHRAKLKSKSQRYRNTKDENLVLSKQVENADLYKALLNKILTTRN